MPCRVATARPYNRLRDTIWPLAVPVTLLSLWVAMLAVRSGNSMLSPAKAASFSTSAE
jgi:hypothetical protein